MDYRLIKPQNPLISYMSTSKDEIRARALIPGRGPATVALVFATIRVLLNLQRSCPGGYTEHPDIWGLYHARYIVVVSEVAIWAGSTRLSPACQDNHLEQGCRVFLGVGLSAIWKSFVAVAVASSKVASSCPRVHLFRVALGGHETSSVSTSCWRACGRNDFDACYAATR